jgi:hypothetical protein
MVFCFTPTSSKNTLPFFKGYTGFFYFIYVYPSSKNTSVLPRLNWHFFVSICTISTSLWFVWRCACKRTHTHGCTHKSHNPPEWCCVFFTYTPSKNIRFVMAGLMLCLNLQIPLLRTYLFCQHWNNTFLFNLCISLFHAHVVLLR